VERYVPLLRQRSSRHRAISPGGNAAQRICAKRGSCHSGPWLSVRLFDDRHTPWAGALARVVARKTTSPDRSPNLTPANAPVCM
jgi:hypothetical protein